MGRRDDDMMIERALRQQRKLGRRVLTDDLPMPKKPAGKEKDERPENRPAVKEKK